MEVSIVGIQALEVEEDQAGKTSMTSNQIINIL
jgi:hypothetical protein